MNLSDSQILWIRQKEKLGPEAGWGLVERDKAGRKSASSSRGHRAH